MPPMRLHRERARLVLSFLLRSLALAALLLPAAAAMAAGNDVRVGVLAFGSVNWELATVARHGFDRANGIALQVVQLAGKDGAAVALQGGSVDVIVTDWLWVSKRRSEGADFTFVPHSSAVGGVMVRPDSGIRTLADLKGRKLGVAGGPTDKSWIMLRAYARKVLGVDLAKAVEPVYGAPPLLNALMERGEIPAALNFWPYEARLRAAGMRQLVDVADMLPALGLKQSPPIVGWVFSEHWAAQHAAAIDGFLKATAAAEKLLATSDAEWQRLAPLTQAGDAATLTALRDAYRGGIIADPGPRQAAAAETLMAMLHDYAAADAVGAGPHLAPGTFWAGATN